MAQAVIMPKQGQSVESCIITQWHKNKGDEVKEGDVLFTYETDKAAFEEKAPAGGILLEIFFAENDDVPCLENVCVIGQPGEDATPFLPQAEERSIDSQAPASQKATGLPPQEASSVTPSDPPQAPDEGTTRISPRAKHLARQQNVSIDDLAGSGPLGRVIERDVQSSLSKPQKGIMPAGNESQDLGKTTFTSHSLIRKKIAAAMHESLASMAQLTLHSSCDASDLLQLRQRLKQSKKVAPTINDLILYAVSRVLPKHPNCNAWHDDEGLTTFSSVHLGVAIDTPRGLMVPTLFHADSLKLDLLAAKVKETADECRQGSISPDKLKNATFTVTNLGALGVEHFTPVINPPQTAILGVGNIQPRVRESGQAVTTYPALGLSLTFDHRALDGAPAARFLQDLVLALEGITLLLIENT